MRSPGLVLPCSIKHATSTHTEGARAMIQVTERARETFKNKLELIERPDVMLRIGRTDSGLGVFPDTLKDDDQTLSTTDARCCSSTTKYPRRSRTRRSTSRSARTALISWPGDSRTTTPRPPHG